MAPAIGLVAGPEAARGPAGMSASPRAIAYRIHKPLPRGLGSAAMPSHFGDPDAEVRACVSRGALFDYSFLLRLSVRGPDAVAGVSALCGRNFDTLPTGCIRYALTADRRGWLVSDLTVWRTAPDRLEVMSGRAQDAAVFAQGLAPFDAEIVDLSHDCAVLAVQGPCTNEILGKLAGSRPCARIPFFCFRDVTLERIPCRVARLGFTGLDGVEILCRVEHAQELWDRLVREVPAAGFCAADRLRLSSRLPLFTQEFEPPVSAADAGLRRIRPDGKALADRLPARVARVCFAATAEEVDLPRALWRHGDPFPPPAGRVAVTSLAPASPTNLVLGMGYIRTVERSASLRDANGILGVLRLAGCP